MAYFNPIMNEYVTRERQQAFQREADRRRLLNIADAQRSRTMPRFLTAIKKAWSERSRWFQPTMEIEPS